MRMDQYMGLSPWAREFLQESETVKEVGMRTYADGITCNFDREVQLPHFQKEEMGKIEGVFDPVVAILYRYIHISGAVFEEFVQASPWSGGPCYFIALKRDDGRVLEASLWSGEAISNC